MMRFLSVRGWSLALFGWAAVSGCDCGGEVTNTQQSLTISFPTEGQLLTNANDENPNISGVQISVRADAGNVADGARLSLSNSTDPGTTVTADVSGGEAVFSDYTLPVGDVTLTVTLDELTASVNITVGESFCVLNTPQDGETLTAADDQYPDAADPLKPFETDVVVDCQGVAVDDAIALVIGNAAPLVAQADAQGRAVFDRVALAEGPNAIELRARTDSGGENPQGAVSFASVTVDTSRCLAFLEPSTQSRLLARDDVDLNSSNGMQIDFSIVTDCPETSTVSVLVQAPGTTGFVAATDGGVSSAAVSSGFRFTIASVNLPESVDPFDVQVIGLVDDTASGLQGVTLPNDYWIDSVAPQILLASPTDGSCISFGEDTSTDPGLQVDAFGISAGSGDGAEVWATVVASGGTATACTDDTECSSPTVCRNSVCRYIGAVAADDTFVVSNVTLPSGSASVEYVVLDLAGNESVVEGGTVSVFDSAPIVSISAPLEGQVLSLADDLDPMLAGLQINVTVAVTDAIASTAGTLTVSGQTPVQFAVAQATGNIQVPVTLDDGQRALLARVPDGCGALVSSPQITIDVASEAGNVAVQATTANNATCGGNTDETNCNATSGCIWVPADPERCVADFANRAPLVDASVTNVTQVDLDVALGTSSFDRTVTVTRSDASMTGMDGRTCSGTSTPVATSTVLGAGTGLFLADVALGADAENCFTVTSDDSVNPVSTTLVLNQRTTVPTIAITDPDGVSPLNTDSNAMLPGFNYTVLLTVSGGVNGDGSNDINGTVSLAYGGNNVFEAPVAAGTVSVTLTDVSLPQGTYDLTPTYTDDLGNASVGAAVNITVDAQPAVMQPQLVLVSPVEGAATNNAGLSAAVTLAGGNTPTTCDLFVDTMPDGSGSPTPFVDDETWGGGTTHAFTFGTAPAFATGTYYVRAECTDGANTGISQVVQIDIDEDAPAAPTFVNEPMSTPGQLVFDMPGRFVNSEVVDNSSVAGLQHFVQVDVAGTNTDGYVVDLDVTPPGLSTVRYSQTLPSTGPFLVDFGSMEGMITFSAQVTDRAGNTSTFTMSTLTIDVQAPVITINIPDPMRLVLNANDDTNTSTPEVDIGFNVTVAGTVLNADCMTNPEDCVSLLVTPDPLSPAPSEFPILRANTGSAFTFQTVVFNDGTYAATFEAQDEAGNMGSELYAFSVEQLAELEFVSPSVGGNLSSSSDVGVAAGYQGNFILRGTGFQPATEVKLCSNVNPPGAGPFEACRWGFDGTSAALGGADAGVVVGTGLLTGSVTLASVLINEAGLSEGAQLIHAEAMEADGQPDLASPFLMFAVDTVPPTISSTTLNQNNAGNDDVGNNVIRLGQAEGTPGAGQLTTNISVQVAGSAAGQTIEILTDLPVANTVVLSTTLPANQLVTSDIVLMEGMQTLSVRVQDEVGNQNDPSVTEFDVLVDVTAPTVSVGAAAFNPFTASNGTINDNGMPGTRSAHTLDIDVSTTFSDNESLDGVTLTLERFSVASGGTADVSRNTALTMGQTSAQFMAYPLAAGLNFIEARVTDASGNETVSTRQQYGSDFYGPLLGLEVRDAAMGAVAGCTSAPGCTADILDPATSSNRAVLDWNAGDAYCPPLAMPCNAAGTDLYFTLSECTNSDPTLEDCTASPLTVLLESRISGTTDSFLTVSQGSFAANGDQISATSLLKSTMPAGPIPMAAFDPGLSREVRLRTSDGNGNESISSSVFLALNADGVIISVEQLDGAGMPLSPSSPIVDNTYVGQATNVDPDPGEYASNLRVNVSVTMGSFLVPTDVDLQINGGGNQNVAIVGGVADYLQPPNALNLTVTTDPNSPNANTIMVSVNCGMAGLCGQVAISNLIADIDAPTYEYDRCTLCDLNVPLVNTAAVCPASCSGATGTDSNIQDPMTEQAMWNAALDSDANPANGFTVGAPIPLKVNFTGLEDGELVTITSNRGGLTGATATSSGCQPVTDCSVTLTAMGVPSLSGTLEHQLNVSATDRAGNVAVPVAGRGTETIYAVTDVDAPDPITGVACIGGSTTPVGVTPASSDPATFEDPVCTAECASTSNCDRRGGLATLTWLASGDDGATGTPAFYDVDARDCSGFTTDIGESMNNFAATQAAGNREGFSVTGLGLHRKYCFDVTVRDDVGNTSTVTMIERDMPLITYPDTVDFTPGSDDDSTTVDRYTDMTSGSTSFNFGIQAAGVGDLDGDMREDFAVARTEFLGSPNAGRVFVFLSSDAANATLSPIQIDAPTSAGSEHNFGSFITGGDFDGDGLSDLMIAAHGLQTTGGTSPGANSGAVFIYWGVSGTGIRQDANAADPELPSINPDVALYGESGNRFGYELHVGDVDGTAGNDLVVGSNQSGNQKKVYVFSGGTRAAFPQNPSPPTPANPVKNFLDLTSAASSGFTDRPDAAIAARGLVEDRRFPRAIALADVDGDGKREIAVSDHFAGHDVGSGTNDGNIYVYQGGALITGELATPTSASGVLKHLIRFETGSQLGNTLAAVPAPVTGDAGEWLLAGATVGSRLVVAFQGTSLGGTPGITPATYPVGGLGCATIDTSCYENPPGPACTCAYMLLDPFDYDGVRETSFGLALTSISQDFDGDGGVDVCVGTNQNSFSPGSRSTFLYSFDAATSRFVKKVVLKGEFTRCVDGMNYLGAASVAEPQLILSHEIDGSFFLFQ